MMILPNAEAVYISHQRCGTHTMFEVLREHYCGWHYKGDGYHGRRVPDKYADWFHFSTCRNPYSLAVSIYRITMLHADYSVRWHVPEIVGATGWLNFARWLGEDRHWDWAIGPSILLPQYVWFETLKLSAILRLEHLEEEANRLPFWHGPAHIDPAANRTCFGSCDDGAPWQSFYADDRVVRAIQAWAKTDFEDLGYDRESYRQLAPVGDDTAAANRVRGIGAVDS